MHGLMDCPITVQRPGSVGHGHLPQVLAGALIEVVYIGHSVAAWPVARAAGSHVVCNLFTGVTAVKRARLGRSLKKHDNGEFALRWHHLGGYRPVLRSFLLNFPHRVTFSMQDSDSDSIDIPMGNPRALFTDAAVRTGLSRSADPLNQMQVDFAIEIVTLCAQIVDCFPDPGRVQDTVGDVLRARLFEL